MKSSRRSFLVGGSAAIAAGAAPRSAWGKTQCDVAIIGAGLAGLEAARQCEAAGLSTIIVEAEDRVGGRLHTLDDLPGSPDAGGIQIGAGYARLHRIANALSVSLIDDAGAGAGRVQSPGNLYSINGVTIQPSRWSESVGNQLPATEKDTEPAALLRRYARILPNLDRIEDWSRADPSLDISVDLALRQASASDEARRLIAVNFNGNDLSSMSQLHLARSFAIYRSQPGPISTVSGGSQRLPEAMAATLSKQVRTGEVVRAISEETDGVQIFLAESSIHARHAICTIPFAALRTIPIASQMSASVARMIAQLPYTRASFAYISAKQAFWESDDFPDTLWSDDPIIGRIFVLGNAPPMLKLWTTGAGADLLDRLPVAIAQEQIVKRIETMRPSAKGQLKVLKLFSWQKSAYARGIYHHIGTGMAADLAASTLFEGKRLHFAGEHLARKSSGMEAALESGERAALRVLDTI